FHLEQNLSWTHYGHPVIRRSLAFSHAGFSRLLSHRLIGKQTNPDLAAALDESRHRNAAGFDLPIGDPSRLEHLQSVVPESQLASAPRLPGHAPALLLAVLNFFRHQHKSALGLRMQNDEVRIQNSRPTCSFCALLLHSYFCILTSAFLLLHSYFCILTSNFCIPLK